MKNILSQLIAIQGLSINSHPSHKGVEIKVALQETFCNEFAHKYSIFVLVKEAKKAEYQETTGDFIPDGKINTLEDIDFDNEELLKVMFKKEFGKELSDHDKEEILNFIKFKANK